MTKRATRQPQGGKRNPPEYHLCLFVAGDEPNSAMAKASLDRICSEHPGQLCQIEIVDVLKDLRPALEEKVLVTPALVIRGPERRTVIFGTLADTGKVLAALQVGSESL